MKKLIFSALIILGFVSCDNYPIVILKNNLTKAQEYGYFEGQKDAIEGDIRIRKIEDSTYIWSKSPWDDSKKQPLYNPQISIESNFK